MKPLVPKQQRFVDEYLIDLNATAAYKRAGYKAQGNSAEASASVLLRNPKVQEAVQAAIRKRQERVELSQDYVIRTILDTIERCRQARPVFDKKGEPVFVMVGEDENKRLAPAYTFEASAVLKGTELLGRHLKMFTDKFSHSGDVTVEITRFGAGKEKTP